MSDISIQELADLFGYTASCWDKESMMKHLHGYVKLSSHHEVRHSWNEGRRVGGEERQKVVDELARINANYGKLTAKFARLKAAHRQLRAQMKAALPFPGDAE